MRRMILAIASIGMALLFGAVATPGLAGEAGLQSVGYRHGSYYCQSRECAAYYNCGYYKRCCSYSIMTVRLTMAAADTIRSATTAVADITARGISSVSFAGGLGRPLRFHFPAVAVAPAQWRAMAAALETLRLASGPLVEMRQNRSQCSRVS